MNLTSSYDQLLAYWENRARTASTDCERVEFSQRSQRMRFETFILSHELNGKSVLDVGCGLAHFWEHLQRRSINCEYFGVDISGEMIRRCSKKFPALHFENVNILNWEPGRVFDYSVAFGIHNIKVNNGYEVLERVTERQFELSGIAAHVSLLTDRYKGFADHIQAWRAEEILSLALNITSYVTLRHDYLPNDLSVTLYRKPLIDTRSDLILDN